MITIPYNPWVDGRSVPGTWHGGNTGKGRSASICCPKCKKIGTLTDHTISGEGKVNPSLVCPNDKCNFHEYVQLEGWK